MKNKLLQAFVSTMLTTKKTPATWSILSDTQIALLHKIQLDIRKSYKTATGTSGEPKDIFVRDYLKMHQVSIDLELLPTFQEVYKIVVKYKTTKICEYFNNAIEAEEVFERIVSKHREAKKTVNAEMLLINFIEETETVLLKTE